MIGRGVVLQTPSADGTDGQVLKTNGAGILSFVSVGGGVDVSADYDWTGNHFFEDPIIMGTKTFAGTHLKSVANGVLEIRKADLSGWGLIKCYSLGINGQTIYRDNSLTSLAGQFVGEANGGLLFAQNQTTGHLTFAMQNASNTLYSIIFQRLGRNKMVIGPQDRLVFDQTPGANASTSANASVRFVNGYTNYVGLQLTGIAAQTADMLRIENSAATELFAIESDGSIDQASGAKVGFMGAAPVAQKSVTGIVAGFTAGSGTPVNHDSTFTGNNGSTAYTVGDVVDALKQYGLLAA